MCTGSVCVILKGEHGFKEALIQENHEYFIKFLIYLEQARLSVLFAFPG